MLALDFDLIQNSEIHFAIFNKIDVYISHRIWSCNINPDVIKWNLRSFFELRAKILQTVVFLSDISILQSHFYSECNIKIAVPKSLYIHLRISSNNIPDVVCGLEGLFSLKVDFSSFEHVKDSLACLYCVDETFTYLPVI